MFDLGWTEFIVVAVVAILVVGPKELPGMLRTIGKTIGNMRRMAGDFQRQMNDALKEADLDGIKTGIDSINSINPVSQLKSSLNPVKQAAEDVQRDINKGLLNAGEGTKPKADAQTASVPDAVAAGKPKAAAKPKTAAKPRATTKSKAAEKPAAGKTAATKATSAKGAATKTTTAKATAAKATPAKATAAKTSAARKPAAKKTTAKTAGTSKKDTDA
ncbi:MAG: Sec-independent protein translocase protein TatB [Alphaproteobacteria bacterium]|nr:Sec-independent protein translocase protein TatB [Alphaproteobacteria bacterium]